jgi:hypothetical protein
VVSLDKAKKYSRRYTQSVSHTKISANTRKLDSIVTGYVSDAIAFVHAGEVWEFGDIGDIDQDTEDARYAALDNMDSAASHFIKALVIMQKQEGMERYISPVVDILVEINDRLSLWEVNGSDSDVDMLWYWMQALESNKHLSGLKHSFFMSTEYIETDDRPEWMAPWFEFFGPESDFDSDTDTDTG